METPSDAAAPLGEILSPVDAGARLNVLQWANLKLARVSVGSKHWGASRDPS